MIGDDAPNVLVISLDSTRRDLIGTYGGRPRHAPNERTTPNIDRLAAEGAVFERASATSSWTLPSHVSLLTGWSEVAHGVDLDGQRLSDEIPLLAETLSRAGYRTAGFFSGPYLEARFGFGRGFDRYESVYGEELGRAWSEADSTSVLAATGDGSTDSDDIQANTTAMQALENASHRDSSSKRVTDALLLELDEIARDDRRFFLFAHYFDPHYDYLPPAPHDSRFDPGYEGALDGADFFTRPEVATFVPVTSAAPSGRKRVVGARDLEHVFALYEGELAWTDAHVGRVLDRLDELGLADDTLVILVSDHGDEFFEHGGIGHRRTLFEEVLAVPLIVRWPGRIRAGARVDATISLARVAPTVLDAVGLGARERTPFASLLPLLDDSHAADAGALARIVNTRYVDEIFSTGENNYEVACTLITIVETWRQGSIKVTREREWLRAGEPLPPALVDLVANRSAAMRDDEQLRWIDLARAPGEGIEDHSTDFGSAESEAALAALRAFHDRYVGLLAARHAPYNDPLNEDLAATLAGLGYVSTAAAQGVLPADDLVLPPPGASILGARD